MNFAITSSDLGPWSSTLAFRNQHITAIMISYDRGSQVAKRPKLYSSTDNSDGSNLEF